MSKFTKTILIAMLLAVLPLKQFAQQPRPIKLTDYNFHNLGTIEERVFLLHSIQESEFFSYALSDEEGKIDIFVAEDYQCEDSNANSDFDNFLESLYEKWISFSNLDKTERGELFVRWRYLLDDPTFIAINEDFHRQLRNRDNSTCEGADPFCTDNGLYQFPASTNAGNLGSSTPPYYCSGFVRPTGYSTGCLSTTPNPAFYYMQIDQPGNLNIYMYSTPSVDIDFDCWGPFSDINTACSQLSCSNMVDCSYSANPTENCYINNAQSGQYYILLITNYSNQTCNISFSNIGTGTTNCGILPPLVDNTGPYCVGETIYLTANGQAGASYSWTGPGNFSSNQQNPTRPNCTMAMAGTYTCTIAVGSQTNSATTDVVIYPMPTANFTYTSVCVGNTTSFTSTSTTNPSGQNISSYQWNFGDGQNGSGQNVTHTYASAGTYQVTLTVSTGGHCTSQKTQSVPVYAAPSCNFTYTTVCQGSATQFTSTANSSPGNPITSYQWNFGDGQTGQGQTVSHTYAQAGTYQVTHTVQTSGSCSDSRTQAVPVNAAPTPTATANPTTIIYGGTATLTCNAGSQGSFNFHWEPANKVVNPNNQTTQTVQLFETTTFTCTVTNPQGNCTGSTQVTVAIEGSNMTATATADQNELCEGESTTLHAQPAGGTGNYTFSWTPANTLNNPNIQNPVATPPLGTTTYTCQVSDGLSNQNVSVSVTVHPNVESNLNVSICPDDTYNFFGEELSQEGTYDHTIESQYGCDSTIHLHLTYHETYETPITRHYCQGETYSFYGEELNSAGIYYHTLETVHGCDSVIRLNLVEDPSYTFYPIESTCEGGPGFLFDGQYLQPRTEPYTFTYETVAGCDSIYIIQVNESEYNSKNYNVSICATEYTWPSNGHTYYETGVYYDTLHFEGSCDSTLVLNLELRPSYDTDVVTTSCDTYRWKNDEYNVDMTFEHSTTYTHHYTNIYGCESEVTLYLTINDHDETEFTVSDAENCDSYYWDPMGHEIIATDHEDLEYDLSGTYYRTYKNAADCDSIVAMHVQFEYTPSPSEVYPVDANNATPHWVITATEFQINSYDFSVWEAAHPATCHWDSITWAFETPNIQWFLEPDQGSTPPGKTCKMYVLNYIEDTVWLNATVYNRCAPEGRSQRYWFVCSFYGVDEEPVTTADFNVIPNPNNGTMTLNFEKLTGKIDLKVYDMRGTLIDNLTTYSIGGPETMLYDMKHRADGIYFFVATGKEGTVAKKVVVRR